MAYNIFYCRVLYWSDWGTRPFIRRMGMDGSAITDIVTTGLYWPNGLALDFYSERIWWCDAQLDRIE